MVEKARREILIPSDKLQGKKELQEEFYDAMGSMLDMVQEIVELAANEYNKRNNK